MKSDALSYIFRDYIQSSFAYMRNPWWGTLLRHGIWGSSCNYCSRSCSATWDNQIRDFLRSLPLKVQHTLGSRCTKSPVLAQNIARVLWLEHYSLLALPTEFVGLRTRVRPVLFTVEAAAVFPWLRLTLGLKYFFHRSRLSRWKGVSLPLNSAPFSVSIFWLIWWHTTVCL
jgi:hypothetical protein